MTKRNSEWFVSGQSTAKGIICEWNPMDGYVSSTPTVTPHYAELPQYNLRGFLVSASSATAASTLPVSLRYGNSSAGTLSTIALCADVGSGNKIHADNLMGIQGGYFALYTSQVHADGGIVGCMWGN